MEGCRVYRVADPPTDWRERLRLAQDIVARCAEGSPAPVLTVSGRGLDGLRSLPAGLAVTNTMLWGYLGPGGLPEAERRTPKWLESGDTVYVACDRDDDQSRLLGGARAYCHPEIGKSTLMLTVPPHDRTHAERLLAGMIRSVGAAGLLQDGGDAEGIASSLLAETRETVRLGPLEVRPTRIGDHPHLFRLAREDLQPLTVLAAMDECVRGPLGAPDRVYFYLYGPGATATDLDGLAFDDGPHWRVRATPPQEATIETLLAGGLGMARLIYGAVRWSGQPEAAHSEVTAGLSQNVLVVTVDSRVDADAVERALREHVPHLERGLDMPFE